jgi:starch-binding outer membrane protein, SusD/RagB family
MKNRKLKTYALITALVAGAAVSCDDSFLEQPPQGVFAYPSLTTSAGLEGMLINAYSQMKGSSAGWYTSPVNWVWGSAISDEAYKGSEKNDQADVNPLQRFEVLPGNPLVENKWRSIYNHVARANTVLAALKDAQGVGADQLIRIQGEARFLRGLSHLEAIKVYGNVPYVDENETEYKVPNNSPIYDQVAADFRFAYENLPGTMNAVGRANKWAAGAYLAKTLMFKGDFGAALTVLNDVIANGTTSAGVKYGLWDKFNDAFLIANENGKESVFGMQFSVGDGSTTNGNYEMTLAYPAPIFTGCCGFYQPSQNLVNSYKTDGSGLPLLDTFNDTDVTNDDGKLSTDAFTEHTGTLDPRIDWTVGRRGIPYLDYGDHPGRNWIRDQDFSGPYSPKKNVFSAAERDAKLGGAAGWGWNNSAKNFILMRFSDVILMAAECEAEAGTLANATTHVNTVRTRAANPAGFVKEGNLPAGAPAANYLIGNYATFGSKADALKAIRFERKLELAMEGHRFFDLVRWGIAKDVMNAYLAEEGTKRVVCLGGATFKDRNIYQPIPTYAITNSIKDGQPTLTQNPGY